MYPVLKKVTRQSLHAPATPPRGTQAHPFCLIRRSLVMPTKWFYFLQKVVLPTVLGLVVGRMARPVVLSAMPFLSFLALVRCCPARFAFLPFLFLTIFLQLKIPWTSDPMTIPSQIDVCVCIAVSASICSPIFSQQWVASALIPVSPHPALKSRPKSHSGTASPESSGCSQFLARTSKQGAVVLALLASVRQGQLPKVSSALTLALDPRYNRC